jgi:hypothetical protein
MAEHAAGGEIIIRYKNSANLCVFLACWRNFYAVLGIPSSSCKTDIYKLDRDNQIHKFR